MPETPKLFRKKSKVKNFFSGLAREVLTGEDLPVRVPGVATGNTVAISQGYPSLPSEDSESEGEMEGPSHPGLDGMAEMRQQFILLQAQLAETKKEMAEIKKKDKDKSFAQTWQESATPETQDPIGRVVAMLERHKVEDSQEYYISWLKQEKEAGRVDRNTLRDLSKAEADYEKRLLDFSCRAPTYDGNPSKVFDWCGELEKHLSRYKCETIPNDAIKRMLLDCITGKAQSEIVLLKPDGLAFDNYEIGEFFQELLKKFTHEKDEEGRKMEYLQRRQMRNEDARQYYTDKLRLFVQAYPPARRSLVEFKTNMLMGLYNADLRKTCLIFMPKEIKHEREIKAVLDHQLINLRTYNMDPRAPAQDMSGLHSTYGNDRNEMSKANEMLKTGQVPMDVNAMPGLVEDVSDVEDVEGEGGVNALQNGDTCYFCEKTGHQKRECRKFDEWKKKNPHRKPGGNTGNPRSTYSRPPISCYNCGKEGHISRECRGERRNQGRRGNDGDGGGQMADMAKSLAAMQEVLKKLVPEAVFP